MKILVIDQCSKAKEYRDDFTAVDESIIDENGLADLKDRSQTPVKEARKLYAGRQQQYVTEAVDRLRAAGDEVHRYFISAGFGLVSETELLPPYDVTFSDYSKEEIRDRGEWLGIETDLRKLLLDDLDLVYFALGNDYYASFDLATVLEEIPSDTWVVCFNHESITESFENVVSLPARTEEAKEQETIVVALKGKYLQHFATHRSHGKQVTCSEDIEKFCTSEYTTQNSLDQHDE